MSNALSVCTGYAGPVATQVNAVLGVHIICINNSDVFHKESTQEVTSYMHYGVRQSKFTLAGSNITISSHYPLFKKKITAINVRITFIDAKINDQ